MQHPAGDGFGPEPSAAQLPCRSKAQELRANMSSNSLRFLTPGRAIGLYRLWVPMSRTHRPPGAAADNLRRHFYINIHAPAGTTKDER